MRPRLRLRLRSLMAAIAALALILGTIRWALRPIDATDAVRIATDRLAEFLAKNGEGPPDVVRVDVRAPGWYVRAPGWYRRVSPGPAGPYWCVEMEYTAGAGPTCLWRCILATDGTVRAREWSASGPAASP